MKYDLFLCHNRLDKQSARAINEMLRQEYGLETFLDESTLVPGEEWEAAIQGALADSAGCAVLLSENGWGPYQLKNEARPAIARQRSEPGFRLIPVLLAGVSKSAMKELPELFEIKQWIDLSSGVFDRRTVRALYYAARGQNPFPEGRPELTVHRLRSDAIRWDVGARRDESVLYIGAELREAEALAAARPADMSDVVMFLKASRERQNERHGQLLAAHASALAQDRLPLAARLAALALDYRPSPEAHAVLRRAAAWLPVPVTRLEHPDRVMAVISDGDRGRLLTASANGSVFLWDAESLQPLTEVRHEARVNAVAVDLGGEWFAAGGEDGNISIWAVQGGTRLRTLRLGQPIARIDVGGNQERSWLVAVGGDLLPGSPGGGGGVGLLNVGAGVGERVRA